ncbi:MAG: septum formation protein Maf [Bacteroidales bacterium]|nr:septum formation protein Maf [Bacteroidales bacterium]HOY40035.1 Maf family nucleotide pyrophosphatase [Bacteroidales bacterium]HQP04915.1 Maf family nucleotide pyrophosphatase [Bacteroidales bacterium]
MTGKKIYNIILGSASPRRRALLEEMGIPFRIVRIDFPEENFPSHLYREEIALYLAAEKSKHFGNLAENDLLITADTIVWHNDTVLGKPLHYSDAFQMLKRLSNQCHDVITGVCLRSSEKTHCFFAETKVKFADVSNDDIKTYIEKYKPFDKAGAYGIQEWIGLIGIEWVQGSYFNVVGLPTHRLFVELQNF